MQAQADLSRTDGGLGYASFSRGTLEPIVPLGLSSDAEKDWTVKG